MTTSTKSISSKPTFSNKGSLKKAASKPAEAKAASKPAEAKAANKLVETASKPAEAKAANKLVETAGKPAEAKAAGKPAEAKAEAEAGAKAAGKPAEAKAAGKPAEAENVWTINTSKLFENTEIAYIPNPKRVNCAAWSRYEKYSKAKTFGEYLKLNSGKFALADFRYDLQSKFVKKLED